MIPLILCINMIASNAVSSEDVVGIHEWGVILLDESYLYARGCPDGYIDEFGYFQEYPSAQVTAPVVYFHGAECRGDLTIVVPNGDFTLTDPSPDTLYQDSDNSRTGIWKDLVISQDEFTESTVGSITRAPQWNNCFSWAVPLWRSNPANIVHHPGSEHEDKFIYYESSMADPAMFMGDCYNYSGEALLFFAEDGQMVCVRYSVPMETDATGETLSSMQIMAVLSGWASGELLPEEIRGLWETWEPLLRTRCERENLTMLLFPFNEQQVSMVSRIEFECNRELQVEYSRLLLGLGRI